MSLRSFVKVVEWLAVLSFLIQLYQVKARCPVAMQQVACSNQNSVKDFILNILPALDEQQSQLSMNPYEHNPECARYNIAPNFLQLSHAAFSQGSRKTLERAHAARALQCITEAVTSRCGLTYNDVTEYNVGKVFSDSATAGGTTFSDASGSNQSPVLREICPFLFGDEKPTVCQHAFHRRLRTPNGRCNNLRQPLWAAAGTIFTRLAKPAYDDGIGALRTLSVVPGHRLPHGRQISTCVSPIFDAPHPWLSQAAVFYGQFIDHDLVLTPSAEILAPDGTSKPPTCCNTPNECAHDDCFQADIPPDDESYARIGKLCMEFVRSVPALQETCDLGYREQLNENTHFLDLSVVYGSSEEKQKSLRTFRGGLLAVNAIPFADGSDLLPAAAADTEKCRKFDDAHACFVAGDERVNLHPVLTALQTAFLRAHNRLARGLRKLAEQNYVAYNDEALFQLARKILTAQHQHIAYNEFLPILLGQIWMRDPKYELQLCGSNAGGALPYCTPDGYFTGYADTIVPSIIQEFSTAAYRLHSLVPDELWFDDHTERLADWFFKPQFFFREQDGTSMMLEGAARFPGQWWDGWLVRSLRDELFREREKQGGLGKDLLTLNIYRGRDHGLQGYNFYREQCGFGRAQSWADFSPSMSDDAIKGLQCAYEHVDDVDLFVGCNAEHPQGDSVIGATSACIISQQFHRLRTGDRFWYENPGEFDPFQLGEIRSKTLLSALFCHTSRLKLIQPHVMWLPSSKEKPVPCEALPSLNLKPFLPLLVEFAQLLANVRPPAPASVSELSFGWQPGTGNFFPSPVTSQATSSANGWWANNNNVPSFYGAYYDSTDPSTIKSEKDACIAFIELNGADNGPLPADTIGKFVTEQFIENNSTTVRDRREKLRKSANVTGSPDAATFQCCHVTFAKEFFPTKQEKYEVPSLPGNLTCVALVDKLFFEVSGQFGNETSTTKAPPINGVKNDSGKISSTTVASIHLDAGSSADVSDNSTVRDFE